MRVAGRSPGARLEIEGFPALLFLLPLIRQIREGSTPPSGLLARAAFFSLQPACVSGKYSTGLAPRLRRAGLQALILRRRGTQPSPRPRPVGLPFFVARPAQASLAGRATKKGHLAIARRPWARLVGVAGFEPAAPCSQSRCANRTALHPESYLHKCRCAYADMERSDIVSMRYTPSVV